MVPTYRCTVLSSALVCTFFSKYLLSVVDFDADSRLFLALFILIKINFKVNSQFPHSQRKLYLWMSLAAIYLHLHIHISSAC